MFKTAVIRAPDLAAQKLFMNSSASGTHFIFLDRSCRDDALLEVTGNRKKTIKACNRNCRPSFPKLLQNF